MTKKWTWQFSVKHTFLNADQTASSESIFDSTDNVSEFVILPIITALLKSIWASQCLMIAQPFENRITIMSEGLFNADTLLYVIGCYKKSFKALAISGFPKGHLSRLCGVIKDSVLTELCLSGSDFGDPGASKIANVLPSLLRLERLYLNSNKIGISGATALTQACRFLPELSVLKI